MQKKIDLDTRHLPMHHYKPVYTSIQTEFNEIIDPGLFKQASFYLRENKVKSINSAFGTFGKVKTTIFYDLARVTIQPWL